MSYSSPDHLGAWTAFGAMPAAEAAALTAQVNARVAEIRNAGTQLITELNSSAVARVFVQQGIDAAGNVVDVINNALSATGTVPSLLKKAIAGDTAAPQKILDLLEKFQQTLLDLRADFDSLWAQAGTASANCTITFANAFSKKPRCWCNDETSILVIQAITTPTTLKCTAAITIGTDVITYGCQGAP